MQTVMIVLSILASFAAWLLGMTHAVYVHGPYGHYPGRSSADAWTHVALASQQDPFYPDELDEGLDIKSSGPEKPEESSQARKSGVEGKSESERVDIGGSRLIQQKKNTKQRT